MKTVGVNRAPARIRPSGWVRDSGRDTFTKKKNKTKQMKNKQKRIKQASWNLFGSANWVGLERGATSPLEEPPSALATDGAIRIVLLPIA